MFGITHPHLGLGALQGMATREAPQNMKAPEFAKRILRAGLSDAGRRVFQERISDRYKAAADLFVQVAHASKR